nr:hypothetical protein BaRGS_004409 [Batillaria attramentaria]
MEGYKNSFQWADTTVAYYNLAPMAFGGMSACATYYYHGSSADLTVHADNYKLCCPAILPAGFNINNCLVPSDVISSCDNLLRSNTHRALLSLYAVLILLGNTASLVVRRLAAESVVKFSRPGGQSVSH